MQKLAKQNYPGSVAFYDTLSRNEEGLFYNGPQHTCGAAHCKCELADVLLLEHIRDLQIGFHYKFDFKATYAQSGPLAPTSHPCEAVQ